MYPEDLDQLQVLHMLLKTQRLFPMLIGEVVDLVDMTFNSRFMLLQNLFIKKPQIYCYILDMFYEDVPER
jgi:hypothetical protein